MTLPINPGSFTGIADTGAVGRATPASVDHASSSGTIANSHQDWFSAAVLDNGRLIDTNRFDHTANRMSVEQAVGSIVSRLIS